MNSERNKILSFLPTLSGSLLLFVLFCVVHFALSGGNMLPQGSVYNYGEEHIYDRVNLLYVELTNIDLVVEESPDTGIHVYTTKNTSVTVYYDESEGELYIYQERANILDYLPLPWRNVSARIYIELPEIYAASIDTSSGNVRINNIRSDELYVYTTSGTIDLTRADIAAYTYFNTTSGDITVSRFYAPYFQATTDTGKISLEESYAQEVSLTSSSGDQFLCAEIGAYAYLYTDSGRVTVKSRYGLAGWVRTDGGGVTIVAEQDAQTVNYSTYYGLARIDRDGVETEDGDMLTYHINGKGPEMDVYTGSGNLSIQ